MLERLIFITTFQIYFQAYSTSCIAAACQSTAPSYLGPDSFLSFPYACSSLILKCDSVFFFFTTLSRVTVPGLQDVGDISVNTTVTCVSEAAVTALWVSDSWLCNVSHL